MVANCVALAGVSPDIRALAAGKGPRTPTNDIYHRTTLALIGATLILAVLHLVPTFQ